MRMVVVGIACFATGAAIQRAYDVWSRSSTMISRERPTALPDAAAGATPGGVAAQPPDLANEPLWAYGFDKPAQPGERARPQAPPSRKLRANEDAGEQTRLRHLEGTGAQYSLVDV